MRIVDRNTVLENVSSTKTVQNFGTLLGKKPHKMGQVVTMYPELAISNLTEALRNVYTKKKGGDAFTPINSMTIEWSIKVNFIKKVRIVGTTAAPVNGVYTLHLEEKYYDKNDTMVLENKQQLFVVAPPKKVSDKDWEHKVIIVASDPAKLVDPAFLTAGRITRYRSNYHPELSERGYIKYISNTETHRNYLSRHRASVDFSGDFALMEDTFIDLGKGKNGEQYAKMNTKEKECMDSYLVSREQSMLFAHSNFDANGKCMMQDEKGRDVPIGDGVIAQIERYCDKFAYSVLSIDLFEDVIAAMVEKSDTPIGNNFAFVVNERLWFQIGKIMKADLRFISPAEGSYFWSKQSNSKVKVGAQFDTYTFQGNSISFVVDRSLSQEYPDYGYG
ncbi:MAG: hypothetical protein KAH32_06035, partial [Chlamydiia bacterium]|nr:hypothetical protein [Chlamydiia bacterium]